MSRRRWVALTILAAILLGAYRFTPLWPGPWPPLGATRLNLTTQPAHLLPAFGCMAAGLLPIQFATQDDDATFIEPESGEPVEIVWPAGWAAWRVNGRGELYTRDGVFVAREGDVIPSQFAGGSYGDGFLVCDAIFAAPIQTGSPAVTPIAVASTPTPSSPGPSQTPRPGPTLRTIRFDVINGPLTAIVWITSDIGTSMTGLHPNERATLNVPVRAVVGGGVSVEVYGDDGCNLLANLQWLPDPPPSTLELMPDSDGTGYEISVTPEVKGAPLPDTDYLQFTCSG